MRYFRGIIILFSISFIYLAISCDSSQPHENEGDVFYPDMHIQAYLFHPNNDIYTDLGTGSTLYYGYLDNNVPYRDILFKIENREHDVDLNLTADPPVIIEGINTSMFTILDQPVTPIQPTTNDIFDFSYTTFNVRFTRPSEFGNRKVTMTIENDDPDENPYIINLEGSICQKRELREWVEDTQFFTSASISGDVIIAGSRMELNEGHAYIFYRNHGSTDNWGLVKELSASFGSGIELYDFGISVAISGDNALVGGGGYYSPYDAYIFNRNEGGDDNWGEVKRLTPADTSAYFGWSVAISGYYALIGAQENGAYIFYRNHGGDKNWGEVKKISMTGGYSVSIFNDYALVGDIYNDENGTNSGAVYVYNRNQGGTDNWGEVTQLYPGDGEENDNFGTSVSISGDYIIVSNKYNKGYLYYRNQGGADNWGEIKNFDTTIDDRYYLGDCVALLNDYLFINSENGINLYYRFEGGTDNWGLISYINRFSTNDPIGEGDWGGVNSFSVENDFIVGTGSNAIYIFGYYK